MKKHGNPAAPYYGAIDTPSAAVWFFVRHHYFPDNIASNEACNDILIHTYEN